MSGFVRDEIAPESLNQSPAYKKKSKHDYLKKLEMQEYYIALMPVVEGFEPEAYSYHIEAAAINVKGKANQWRVRAACLGKVCAKCEENRVIYKKSNDAPFEMKSHLGKLFMAYLIYPNLNDGTFRLGSKKEPLLCEYWYRFDYDSKKMVCDDWNNLMDAFENAVADGRDPLDPNNAVIFHVQKKKGNKEAVESGKSKEKLHERTHWIHTYLKGKSIQLPNNYLDIASTRYKFSDLSINFSSEDLKTLVTTSRKISELMVEPKEEIPEAKAKRLMDISSLYQNYGKIGNVDFRRILESLEKPDDKNQQKTANNTKQNPSSSPVSQAKKQEEHKTLEVQEENPFDGDSRGIDHNLDAFSPSHDEVETKKDLAAAENSHATATNKETPKESLVKDSQAAQALAKSPVSKVPSAPGNVSKSSMEALDKIKAQIKEKQEAAKAK